ncbi:MAG TPA: S-methyl-5-thioribose-1-phosphate isomerase, partial [Patescibacteria group bacterium]|nr:S-methyl-5-thioribose-1-phosphate isomerase [Patescibacteria group bacterium]
MLGGFKMRTIEWHNGKVRMIDQTLLPRKLKLIYVSTAAEMVNAIKTMKVRGAPAIGAAAAFGCVLGSNNLPATARRLIASRPTAVNLQWAVKRMLAAARAGKNLLQEALEIAD